MKWHTVFFLLFTVCSTTFVTSCGDDDPEFLFEVDHVLPFTLPAGQNTLTATVVPYTDIRSRVLDGLLDRGLDVEDVRTVLTTVCSIDQTSLENDLSVIQEATVNVYTGDDPLANPFEAAYSIQLEDRQTDRIRLVPSLTNLRTPLTASDFNLELVVNWRRISTTPINGFLTIRFGVESS